jgi:hypothetical protein
MRAIAAACILLTAIASACMDRNDVLPTDTGHEYASMTRQEARELIEALVDSLPDYGNSDAAYLNPAANLRRRTNAFWPSDEPPRDHDPWMIDAFLATKRFGGLCRPDDESKCDIGVKGSVFEFTPMYRLNRSDTIFVGVDESWVCPRGNSEPCSPFGAYTQVLLLRKGGAWVVVGTRLLVVT